MKAARERILERRAQFVAAALSLAGCRQSAPTAQPAKPTTPDVAKAALDGARYTDAGPIDSDGDGVPDIEDKCPMVPGTKEGCPGPCLTIVTATDLQIGNRVYFADKSSKLAKDAMPVLDVVAELMTTWPTIVVEVRGHIDTGEPKALAEQRAHVVVAYLVSKGIDVTRFSVRDLGATVPSDEKASPTIDAHMLNRRVDFRNTTLGR